MNETSKIGFNSIVLFVRLCIVTVVSLVAARVVLDALGVADYGLYNVVGGIVLFINVINNAMLSTTYRYIAFEIGKKDKGNPQKVFSTSFFIHLFIAVAILVIGAPIGEWYIDNYLNVAQESIPDARFVFHVSLATTSISAIFVPYQGLLVALEKFSTNAIIDSVTQLAKLAAIMLLLYSDSSRIRVYSLIMMAYVIISGLCYVLISNYSNKHITRVKFQKDKTLYNDMLSYAIWTLFGAVASLGKNQGSAIVINFFWGTIVNAAFAVANQVESFISLFAGTIGQAAIPQITKSYSGGNQSRSIKLTCYISKYTFLMMLLVAFPVILDMDFLLGLWLKEIPEGTVVFCKLIVLGGLLSCLGAGIPALVNATGKIRNYQIITHTFNLVPLFVSIIGYKLGSNQYSISAIYCIFIFLSAFLKLYLLRRLFNFNIMDFINISYLKMLYVSIPLLIYYFCNECFSIESVGEHILSLVIAMLFLVLDITIVGLTKDERTMVISMIKNKLRSTK